MLKFFKTFCIFNMFHKKTLQKKRKKYHCTISELAVTLEIKSKPFISDRETGAQRGECARGCTARASRPRGVI